MLSLTIYFSDPCYNSLTETKFIVYSQASRTDLNCKWAWNFKG